VSKQLDERIIIDADTYFRTGSNKLYLRPLNAVSVKLKLPSYSSQGSDDDEAEEMNAVPNGHRSTSMVVRRADQVEENEQVLTDDQCLICSPWVKGYALKSKQWTAFLVKNVRAISWNQDAFDHLVLPQGYKDLILGFVQGQLTNSKDFDDLIDGKGRGLTLLLSGPPGVGKTLTAEVVAEKLEAPLGGFGY
jgi:Cdc6-like AAA superfamily ATPase